MKTQTAIESDPDALWRGRRVLVTGASGFIGAHLCRRLVDLGAEVHGVSRSELPADRSTIRWWRADLSDETAVRQMVAGSKPEVIMHLAGEVVGAREMAHIVPTLRGNLLGTVHILLAAAANGCRRVVLTGSLEEPAQGEISDVSSSPYAASKAAATGYGRMFHALYGLDVVMLRVFMVYGPAQRDLRKLVPFVILSLLRGETPKMSSGLRPVDWIYVDDVVEAFVAAGLEGGSGETLDVGSARLVTVREFVERLAPMVRPDARLRFDPSNDRPLEQVRVADLARIGEALGWSPRVSLDDGLRRTVDWYRANLGNTGAGGD